MNIRMNIFQFMHFVSRVNRSAGKYTGGKPLPEGGNVLTKTKGAPDKLSGAPLLCQPETSFNASTPTKEVLMNAVQR